MFHLLLDNYRHKQLGGLVWTDDLLELCYHWSSLANGHSGNCFAFYGILENIYHIKILKITL